MTRKTSSLKDNQEPFTAKCSACGGQMSIIAFIEDHKVIDKIIDHLKLTSKAERPPPPKAQLNMAAEERSEYV